MPERAISPPHSSWSEMMTVSCAVLCKPQYRMHLNNLHIKPFVLAVKEAIHKQWHNTVKWTLIFLAIEGMLMMCLTTYSLQKQLQITQYSHHAVHCANLELLHSVYRPVGVCSTLVFAPSEDGNGESRMHELLLQSWNGGRKILDFALSNPECMNLKLAIGITVTSNITNCKMQKFKLEKL